MIEKIYIPTVHRVDQQITYNNLPDELKKSVVFVVQAWEREQYKYDAQYLVLPDTEEYHYSHYYCISHTRKYIYEIARNIKYAMIDDDVLFGRRNSKYWTGNSNMEKSKRIATKNDTLELFDLMNELLDSYGIAGCYRGGLIPHKKEFSYNGAIFNAFFINGQKVFPHLDKMNLTSTGIAEDIIFILHTLMFDISNVTSSEFLIFNKSLTGKLRDTSVVWNSKKHSDIIKDFKTLKNMFDGCVEIDYDKLVGHRNCPNLKINWKYYARKKLH